MSVMLAWSVTAAQILLGCYSACNIGSDSDLMMFSAELAILQRGIRTTRAGIRISSLVPNP
jgi:hypothetical protein